MMVVSGRSRLLLDKSLQLFTRDGLEIATTTLGPPRAPDGSNLERSCEVCHSQQLNEAQIRREEDGDEGQDNHEEVEPVV